MLAVSTQAITAATASGRPADAREPVAFAARVPMTITQRTQTGFGGDSPVSAGCPVRR